MKKIRLGKTELKVTEVGFGGIPIIPLATDEAIAVVRQCYELGFNFFDTANAYKDSEEKLGAALAPFRDDVVIASKTSERNAADAAKHIDLSLQRLKTDRIDIFQLHDVSNEASLQQVLDPGGAYEALDKARDQGKVRYIGISSHSIPVAMKALETNLFQTLQFPFNFIENDPADQLFPQARRMDVGLIGMKPLGGGVLERADLCFGFLQQHPYIVPIPGIQTAAEASEIIDLYKNPVVITEPHLAAMEKIKNALGEKFCHRCEYCMPCDQGVQIPGVLIFEGFAKRFSSDIAASMMAEAMAGVENCIECGQCEEKCPYNLPIPGLLKENLALFKKCST